MKEKKLKNLPLGRQTFKNIIEDNKLYVDKTEEIYKLLENDETFFFLSRPRRFGKSLLVTTLEEIFLGNKELFKGLWIYEKIEFKKYPVILIDFNAFNLTTPELLERSLDVEMSIIARKYNINFKNGIDSKSKFRELIEELGKTEKVVLLIDEYDKPIVDYFNNVKKATANREVLKTFYNTIKSCDKYIHFAFLTGVSKFSKVSIFSTLNNITDITLDEKYSKIVGITEEELYANFEDRIKIFADIKNKSVEKVKKELKDWYNGFSWDGKNFLYNPYSLLLLFSKNVFDNYWFESGTPTFFVDFIKKYKIDIKDIENCVLSRDKFEFFDIEKINPYAVFFQTGYLTIKKIKEYEDYAREYTLSYPNKEVKDSILKYFLLDIVNQDVDSSIIINRIKESLRNKDLDSFFRYLISLFDSIPYQIAPKNKSKIYDKEAYYHSIFHVIFTLIGLRIDSEVSVSRGRVDSVVETDDTVYIFEFKLETNQQNAIGQIMDKKYYSKYSQSKKEVVLVGVIFDMKIKNIKEWEIVKI